MTMLLFQKGIILVPKTSNLLDAIQDVKSFINDFQHTATYNAPKELVDLLPCQHHNKCLEFSSGSSLAEA